MHLPGDESGILRFNESDFLECGYSVIHGAANSTPHEEFNAALRHTGSESRRISAGHSLVTLLSRLPKIADLVFRLLGRSARPVRAIAFDKTDARNWAVPWHQDRTIAVDRRDEDADVRCWTVKNGVPHCEPPVRLLQRMVTLRWHLDEVGPEDGCIRVLPGSHRMGRLEAAHIRKLVADGPAVDVAVPAGGVFVMSPLLVHSSRKRLRPGRRRVLHVELSAGDPPAPLNWARG